MVLLILESLGSTELVFILIMALVFFGPRKLPQLSRTLGKNLASFRRASEDFKSTWDREVSLEEFNLTNMEPDTPRTFADNSILENAQVGQPLEPSTIETLPAMEPPTIQPVPADRVVARGTAERVNEPVAETYDDSAPLPKREWL